MSIRIPEDASTARRRPDEERRRRYLAAMGIRVWRRRDPAVGTAARGRAGLDGAAASSAGQRPDSAPESTAATAQEAPATAMPGHREPTPAAAPQPQPAGAGDSGSALGAGAEPHGTRTAAAQSEPSARSLAPAADDGPPPWLDEPPPWSEEEVAASPVADPSQDPFLPSPAGGTPAAASMQPEPAAPGPAGLDWEALQQAVAGCRACGLCQGRTNTVFGVGDRQAELMLIGEAPGQDEDRQGEPFVGRAGRLLNHMLAAVGLERGQVYIANIVKCRPPNNRNPKPEEAAACQAFLARQIALVQPRLLVSLGGVSATNLLGTSDSVGRLRGRLHHYRASGGARIPLIVTYHPSYYLRSPAEKAKGWQDLQRIVRALRGGEMPR